jgi:hypothetical protein
MAGHSSVVMIVLLGIAGVCLGPKMKSPMAGKW